MISIGRFWSVKKVVAAAVFAVLCFFPYDFGAKPQTTAAEPVSVEKLTTILGSSPTEWQITRLQGTEDDFKVGDIDGEPALSGGPNVAVLTWMKPIAAETELSLRVRLSPPEGKAAYLHIMAGLKKPEENGDNPLQINFQRLTYGDPHAVLYSLPTIPGRTQSDYGYYKVAGLPVNRLTWPNMVRARVEQDAAVSPPLTRRWITLRYVIRKNSTDVYFDNRHIRRVPASLIDGTGLIRLRVYDGAHLASVRVKPAIPEVPHFEMVPLGDDLNATQIKGAAVVRESLPQADQPATVGGVPFLFAAADAKGRNHIDLTQSWLRCGLLEGGFDGAEGEAARWRGALDRDVARIQFRVPNGPYSRLHLIAAADGEPDTVPVVTAQFYRANAGHPVSFAARVPLFAASSSEAQSLPVKLANGGQGKVYLVTIPLEPEGLASLSESEELEFELTKQVQTHRSFPDPTYYSEHQAGLPNGVHVFAATLERPAVEVNFQPDQLAHIWTAPEKPGYTVTLKNTTDTPQMAELEVTTASHDASEKTTQKQTVTVPPRGEQSAKFPLALKRYGYHSVKLQVKDAAGVRTQTRSLAHLHPDTRERGGWEENKGCIFGFWDWAGGHVTMAGLDRLKVMAAAGVESSMQSFMAPLTPERDLYPADEKAFVESKGMQTFFHAYQLTMGKHSLGIDWDPTKPAEMQAALIETLKKSPLLKVNKINKPEVAVFFGEPVLGPVSYMNLPEYYGDPPYQMTEAEEAGYKRFLVEFVTAASAIKKEWPAVKCLMPWGLPTFPVPFLRNSREATELMDGPALDVVLFERLPEMQLHQVTLSSVMWQLKQEWRKAGKPPLRMLSVEGPAISPAAPGSISEQQEADHTLRALLVLTAYGTTRHLGWPVASRCAGSWGESHYGGGMLDRLPLLSPKIVYSAYATLTRQLNRMNYVKAIPTGSLTTFCLQFKHYKTGELLHVFWTVRGKRPVQVDVATGAQLAVFDEMDNETASPEKGGRAEFVVSPAPCFVHGLTGDPKITLGTSDHSDSRPGEVATKLADFGDGTWKLSSEPDAAYESSHFEFVRRFPGVMTLAPAAAPAEQGGKALAVHLEKQEKERQTMPFYATLVPPQPIVIPGKASHLGLWVRASSDWGRVVYSLRDAEGERWLSVGKKGEWNVDDVHCWSSFCFDGWRYLKFELPANAPYDLYREIGTSFWGYVGTGDGVVDLPLTLEKVIVERRTHVVADTELQPASADDVFLAGLFAEYANPADQTPEAVRLSKLRMPLPATPPDLENPITKLAETGTGAPLTLTKAEPPDRESDGTRCLLFFEPMAAAKKYDIWVSPYPDGRGAIMVGPGWTKPGQLLTGLRANIDLYLFAIYTDEAGKNSKPSAGLKINLKDMFPMK